MADLFGLTLEQTQWLQRFIDVNQGKPLNTVTHEGALFQSPPDWIGKVVTVVSEGELDPATDRFQPMNGPAHEAPTGAIGATIGLDYAWQDIDTDQWAGSWSYRGKQYVSPLSCPSPEEE